MNTEQQFVDLIKEGKVADAMQLIKTALTEMAGASIVQTKFDVAEACGMKKSMKEEDDDMDDDDEDEDDEDEDDMDESKDKDKKDKEASDASFHKNKDLSSSDAYMHMTGMKLSSGKYK